MNPWQQQQQQQQPRYAMFPPQQQQPPQPFNPAAYAPQQQQYPPQFPAPPQQRLMYPPPQQQYFPVTQVVPAPRLVAAAPVTSSDLASVPMNVFVGKLVLSVHDSFVEALLKQCGSVLKWKRTVDAETNKAKAFGFCTFANAHGAARAVKLLNDVPLLGQKMLVKVGKKEQVIIDALPADSVDAAAQRIKALVDANDPTKPYGPASAVSSRAAAASSASSGAEVVAASAATTTTTTTSGGDAHDKMIAEEMEKFRSKQAQRDKELEEERRRKLQARIQESRRAEEAKKGDDDDDDDKRLTKATKAPQKKRPAAPAVVQEASPASAIGERSARLGFGIKKIKTAKKTSSGATAAFSVDTPPPRVLKTLDDDDDGDEDAAPAPPADDAAKDDELRRDQQIAERIPTDRDALFALPVDWDAVERKGIVRQKLRPWVAKKMAEYLGEEEPTLIDFVATQLEARAAPQKIQDDLAPVLEDDAQVLVLKLWRVLHFHAAK